MNVLSVPTSLTITTFCVILAAACVFKLVFHKGKYHPVAGTLIDHMLNFNRLFDYMKEMASKYKTYRILNLFQSEIYTSDPANVEYILKTNFPNYGKGWHHYSKLNDLLGDGIFTVDGEKWRNQRKISSYEFSTKNLRDFSSAVFRISAVKLAQKVSEAVTSNQETEIQDLFTKSTLETVFKILLGVDLDTTTEEGILFSNSFDEASAVTLYRYVDIFWKVKRFLNIGSEAKMKKCIKVVDEFVYKIIRNKTEQMSKSRDDSRVMKKSDILSRFLEMNKTDPKYLKDIILSFIIAGKDTTASTLSWFFYMMCKHPLLQEKIAEEVRKATGINQNSSIDEIAKSITDDALDKMQYLHASLTETLRLYPAVPVDGKVCLSDDTFPDGFRVRKGDAVAYQPWAMGRMKSLWGDDAEDFRPERWFDENGFFRQESPFKFTAFQAGPRICLGKEFAYRQMKIFSAVLLGTFRFKMSDEKRRVTYRTMLTLRIDGALHLHASYRLGHQNNTAT
ncbi:cytochrome P450 704C1-like [Solanum dulcamara]|uniref:cytochrome P450 704C1-like n=1 Tax=Solanum dulcamara TaxID=45834 RepID=UPI0024851033|nr:cytochrome P450 704C1-like [Solanum dulcamara]